MDVTLNEKIKQVEYLTSQVSYKDEVIEKYWREIDRLEKQNTELERVIE